jgi:hypothetical protein
LNLHVADAVGQSDFNLVDKGKDDGIGVDLQNRVDELEEQVGALEEQVDELEEEAGALADDNFDLQVQTDALVDDLAQYECVLAGWGFKLVDDGDPVMVDRDLAVAGIALFTQALGSSNNTTPQSQPWRRPAIRWRRLRLSSSGSSR